jgi:hypothetical protein
MVFAAAMMIMLGIWQILVGIAAIAEDGFFVVAPNYTYEIDTTTWGWIHLVLGVVIAVTGLFLFTGALWARAVGITLAGLSAVANFFFLPYYPLWAIVIIAVDVFVIWALATAGSGRPADDLVAPERTEYGDRGAHARRDGTTGARPAAPTGTPRATA